MASLHHLLLFLLLLTFSPLSLASSPNPLSAKAATLRYWSRKIPLSAALPRPNFLLSKLSPLSALDSASFSSLSPASLPAFCAAASLLCGPSLTPSLASHRSDANFAVYDSINFTNYGANRPGGLDSFRNYSDSENVPIDTFRSYSRDGVGHDADFLNYSPDGNVVTDNFTSYGSGATGGNSDFTAYQKNSNVPNLEFTNYAANANGHTPSFTSYADNTNAGDQTFSSYGKNGNGIPTTFTSYANNSNVVNSGFNNYGHNGNGDTDTFSSYGDNGNVPENTFSNYGEQGNAGVDTFTSYRDQSNVGDDTFKSYAKSGVGSTVAFTNYGESFNNNSDTFKSYGEGANDPNVTFKSYSADITNFQAYSKTGVDFKTYKNVSAVPSSAAVAAAEKSKEKSKWVVEPGKFFRESSLVKGTLMPMPDVKDKMPPRAFLPRTIAAGIPFSAEAVQRVFEIGADTAMGKAVDDTLAECARAPSRGETKRCATSAEDVIDFAADVLGGGAVVRSTESARGSGGQILIGNVKGIDGGKVTKAVSCHQSLFPYLVYYCHAVPAVRVYEAEILAVDSKEIINHGVAICHVDTSDWSASHGAFVALGAGPGRIEVCHWIFQGDMTWTVQD